MAASFPREPEVRTVAVGRPMEGVATFPKPGPPGPVGPRGESVVDPLVFPITVPQATITIVHNLGRDPVSVIAIDNNGFEIDLGVQVLDLNTIQLTTENSLAFTGKVLII